MDSNSRIARNTLLLYFRMFLLIVVQLYTVPVILRTLGVSDYGLYYVIGGLVSMFSFLSGSLASGSQRFISFALGKNDSKLLKQIFDATVSIYIVFAIVSFVVLEIGGVWFLNTRMNIPLARIEVANWVYQLSLLAFVINLLTVPFVASVIAHEKMSLFAYLSILECLLKLGVAVSLQYTLVDKLVVYSLLIFTVVVLVQTVYWLFCRWNFAECKRYAFYWNGNTGRELLTYSGWNMVGALALILRQQGLNVLLNLFFGTLLNAAHSIALQINGVLTQFVNNLYMATRPQITKLYAVGDVEQMWLLIFRSAKLAFYLLAMISIPLLLEMGSFLVLWLGKVPQYTVGISILMTVSMLVETQVNQVIAAFQATNRIKHYQIYSSTILLGIVPVSYLCLKWFDSYPILPYILSVFFSLVYSASILWQAYVEIQFNLKKYLVQVIFKSTLIFMLGLVVIKVITDFLPPSLLRIGITLALTVTIVPVLIWGLGLDNVERNYCIRLLKKNFVCK